MLFTSLLFFAANATAASPMEAKLNRLVEMTCQVDKTEFTPPDKSEDHATHLLRYVRCFDGKRVKTTEHEHFIIDCTNRRYKVYRGGFDYDAQGKAMHWDGQTSQPLDWSTGPNSIHPEDVRILAVVCGS